MMFVLIFYLLSTSELPASATRSCTGTEPLKLELFSMKWVLTQGRNYALGRGKLHIFHDVGVAAAELRERELELELELFIVHRP